MTMQITIVVFIIFNLGLNFSNGANLYPNYIVIYDPIKSLEWSNDHALNYISTVRLSDYDHHIFQYRRYPCQYFYTDEIQMNYNNETINECIYNTTTSDYQYSFQLHLDSRHIQPYILRNIAIQCKYINCSLSLLKMKYIRIDWNSQSREKNLNCSFESTQHYSITDTPYILTEWITLRCQSLLACNRSKYNLIQSLSSNIQLFYGSSYELEYPYCSLEKSLSYLIETNFSQTNRLLEQLIDIIQQGFGKPNQREQMHMKEYIEQNSLNNQNNSTTISGIV